nr:HTH-type transcriptional activator NagR-like [Nerophis lumbriciformis]
MSNIDDHGLPTLSQIDLNLLFAFDRLYRERSVTKAAERIGVTQSAMSHTLRRLRDALSDPLFVRGRGGLIPTPRADALVQPIRQALVALDRAVAGPEAFEAATAVRAFRVVSPDIFDVLALPDVLRALGETAPRITLSVVERDARQIAAELETGDVDFLINAVSARQGDLRSVSDPGLQRRTLFRDDFSCFVRRGHPMFRGRKRPRMTLPTFTKLSHALVSPTGEGAGLVDLYLAKKGLERQIALRVPSFTTARMIVAETDLVLTAPTALAHTMGTDAPLLVLKPPLQLPDHGVAMTWHERFTHDPGHRWMRDLIADFAAKAARRTIRRKS